MSKFSFTKHYKVALIIPAVIAVVCLVLSLFGQGMNLGIDFTGGSLLTYDMGGEFDMNKVDEAVKAAGITEYQAVKSGVDVQDTLQIRLKSDMSTGRQAVRGVPGRELHQSGLRGRNRGSRPDCQRVLLGADRGRVHVDLRGHTI